MAQAFSRWMIGAIVAAWTLLALGAEALACSPVPDYVAPTNFELVALADAIVVATPDPDDEDRSQRGLKFRVLSIIKGPPVESVYSTMMTIGQIGPGDPNVLLQMQEDDNSSICIRRTVQRGGRYVLFLERDSDGQLRFATHPFSRVNEDYLGEDSLWVTTIRTYMDIQTRYAPMEQLTALQALLEKNLKLPQTAARMEQERDIVVALSSLSERSPTPRLIAAYEALERGELPTSARLSPAEHDRLFAGFPWRSRVDDPVDFDAARQTLLARLVKGDHPDAAPLFKRLIAPTQPDPRTMGLAIKFFARNGQYRRSYALVEDRALGMLVGMPREKAGELIWDIALAQRGDGDRDSEERWRTDPYAAAAWPELALRLYWFNLNNLDARHSNLGYLLSGAIQAIPVSDYRARPELTLALADTTNDAVRAWALVEVFDLAKQKAWEEADYDPDARDPAELPLQVLLRSYDEDRDEPLDRFFCEGGDRRLLLFRVVSETGGYYARDYAMRLAAWPSYTAEERGSLVRVLVAVGNLDSQELANFINGRPLDLSEQRILTELKPIICPAPAAPKAP